MPNLDFSILDRPVMDDACTYCDDPIREKYICLNFEGKSKIRLHKEPCWENFVTGVKLINQKLALKVN